MTVVVVSPHLDDAVFSCGTFIAAAAITGPVRVLTVCAGVPEAGFVTQLDAAAGFTTSREAVLRRCDEDRDAARVLGFNPVHLDVLDAQYDRDDPLDRAGRIATELRSWLDPGDVVVCPVGIRHIDHVHVAAACKGHAAWLYEELPYRVLWPEMMPARFGFDADVTLPPSAVKRQAVECYRSQIGDGPPGPELVDADERYHRVA